MKKFLSILLSFAMLLSITAGLNLTAYAFTFTGNCGANAQYSFDESTGVLTITGSGDMKDYGHDYDVPWNSKTKSITKVVVSDGITHIGDFAFANTNAGTFSIPDSVTSYGKKAFSDCSAITSFSISNSVVKIDSNAFSGCSNLQSIVVPDSVTFLGEGAFNYCSSLVTATIGDYVTSIGDGTFSFCSNLTSVKLGRSITSIGDYAFSNTSINDIVLPDSLITIGDSAFNYLKRPINTIVFPENVSSIGKDAFYGAAGVNNLIILNGNCAINDSWYTFCSSVKTVFSYAGSTAQSYCEQHGLTFVSFCNNHSFGAEKTEYVANCEFDGRTSKNCSKCNFVSYNRAAKKGHSNVLVNSVDSTCSNEGYNAYRCNVCGKITQTPIAKKPHTVVIDQSVAPTCTQTGLTEGQHCSVCNQVIVAQNVIPATGHNAVSANNGYAQTCTTVGKESDTVCSVCGTLLNTGATLPATGHNAVSANNGYAPNCIADGKENDTICSTCGSVLNVGAVLPALGHDFSNNAVKCRRGCGAVNPNYKPKSAKIKKLTAKKKAVAITWSKVSSISGYQIQLAADKKFKKNKKTVTIKKQKTTKTTVKKLKAKKKYFVRIRTYKTVNGKKIYSSWSKVKSVKTK